MPSNLPPKNIEQTKSFFNDYFKAVPSSNGTMYDALIGYFEIQTQGNRAAAESIATAVLEGCRKGNLDPMAILDALKKGGLTLTQQTQYVVSLLNSTRINSSYLGYKNPQLGNKYIQRTILV